MSVVSCITVLISVLFIINTVSSIPYPEKEGEKPNESSDSDDGEPSVKEIGTMSPEGKEKLKEELIKEQEDEAQKFDLHVTVKPDDVGAFLDEEEEQFGTELPAVIAEEFLEKDNDFKDFEQFHALFLAAVLSKEEGIVTTPEEMKEMKEEIFRLVNEWSKWKGYHKLPQETFDEIWNKKERKYGEKFPNIAAKLLLFLKEIERERLSAENATEEVSEAVSENATQSADIVEEEPPKDAFILKNAKGNICILAKFNSSIKITLPGKSPELKVEVNIPQHNHHTKGKCRGPNGSALLEVTWEKFVFSLYFNKTTEDTWSVTLVELIYDTSEPLFDGAAERKKVTLKSKQVNLFQTPLGKSYFCPGQEIILLYEGDRHVATVRLSKIHLQPYDVEDGKFSTPHRCSKVVIGGPDEEPFVQDETVPLAVGCTLALITLLILVGFSVHRAYNAAKVDYNTME